MTNAIVGRPVLFMLALFAVVATTVCSQVTDEPSDCLADEYFDDNADLCRTCAPATLEACPADCGYVLTENNLGCQVAECVCGVCADGQYFDRDLVTCTACAEAVSAECRAGCPVVGETADELGCVQDVCDCGAPVCDPMQALQCGAEGCCEEVVSTDGEDCPVAECQCPAEAPDGFFFDGDGVCQACDGVDPVPEACANL